MARPKLTVVLPAHNEAENLEKVVTALQDAAPEMGADFALIIVDDGSTDATPEAVAGLRQKYSHIHCIRHPRNLGYGGAVISGFRAADGDYVALMDADGQFDARDLVRLFRHTASCDVVVGYRSRRADPAGRRILGHIWTVIGRRFFRIRIRDLNCGLKVFKRSVLEPLQLRCQGPGINMEIMSQIAAAGIPVREIACVHLAREAGKQSGASFPVMKKGLLELWFLVRNRSKMQ